MPSNLPALLPVRHTQPDFFIADIFDNIPLKDDIASMEHPVFSLSTKPVCRELIYKNGDTTLSFIPSLKGLPTIFDKDVLLYCGSLLMEQLNKGIIPPRTIRVSVHDMLVTTNRTTDGKAYVAMKAALERLAGVLITTNIKTNRIQQTKGFHLIDSYDVIKSSRIKDRMVQLEITLSEWLYNSFVGKEVLTINRDYFRLRKPLERRLYELARKHCGNQSNWGIGLENLRLKTGSTADLFKFRYAIRQITATNHMPDYSISLDDADNVTFANREAIKAVPVVDRRQFEQFNGETIVRARYLIEEAGTGWDFNAIVEQFGQHMQKHGNPKNINGAFIGFVRKKVKTRP